MAANGQGFSASLRYQQMPRSSNLALDGPLGIGGCVSCSRARELQIATSRGEKLDGDAARRARAPARGCAAVGRTALVVVRHPGAGRDRGQPGCRHGEIHDFVQAGWRVSINSRAAGLGFSLPQRLTAERDGARLKLLVERWQ